MGRGSRRLGHLLRTGGGRLRLGWRLLLFLALTLATSGAMRLLLPGGLLSGSVTLLVGAVTSGALLLALDGRPPGALGFYLSTEAIGESARGLALGACVALVVVVVMAAAGALRWSPQVGTPVAWLQGAGGALLLLALPAAAEEALLRGYPLQALSEEWGPGWAVAITAGIFGALHLRNPGLTTIAVLNVAIAGLFLGVVYLRTGSLWWATGAHLGWNWAQGYLADLPVSGLEIVDAPLYQGIVGGPAWLGGGAFGPEGSLVATVVVGGTAVLCWRSDWLRPGATAVAARPLAIVTRRRK